MKRFVRLFSLTTLMFCGLLGCTTGTPSSTTTEATADTSSALSDLTTRAFAFESQIDGIYPIGDICVLYLYDDGNYTGLVVDQDQDEGPLCGAVQPFLNSEYGLLEWNTADATPITDTNTLQNLATAFDQASGRTVSYFTLNGPLREWLWGASYGNGQTLTVPGIGSACALIVETDNGDTVGLLETADQNAACPYVGPFLNAFYSIQVPAEDTSPIQDTAILANLAGAYPGMTIEWRFVAGPVSLLLSGSLGGTFDGVVFTDEQAIATLDIANNTSLEFLDDVVPLHQWAAQNIVSNRPITSMQQLAAVYWVGPSALTHLRDFQCPVGSHFEYDDCVADANPLP